MIYVDDSPVSQREFAQHRADVILSTPGHWLHELHKAWADVDDTYWTVRYKHNRYEKAQKGVNRFNSLAECEADIENMEESNREGWSPCFNMKIHPPKGPEYV